MFNFNIIYFVIFIINFYKISCEISDKRLCVDDECSIPVSLGKTTLRFASPDHRILSFSRDEKVKIYSKEAGSVQNLWGAEIKGKRGYIPTSFVREYQILNKPTKVVDTNSIQDPQVPKTSENEVKPHKPLEQFEIIEGTKLYLNPAGKMESQDNITGDLVKMSNNELSKDDTKSREIKENDDHIEKKAVKKVDSASVLTDQENKESILPKITSNSLNENDSVSDDIQLSNKEPLHEENSLPNEKSSAQDNPQLHNEVFKEPTNIKTETDLVNNDMLKNNTLVSTSSALDSNENIVSNYDSIQTFNKNTLESELSSINQDLSAEQGSKNKTHIMNHQPKFDQNADDVRDTIDKTEEDLTKNTIERNAAAETVENFNTQINDENNSQSILGLGNLITHVNAQSNMEKENTNIEKPVNPQNYQDFDSSISSNIDQEGKKIDSKEHVKAESNLEKVYTNIENQEKPVDPQKYQGNISSNRDQEGKKIDSKENVNAESNLEKGYTNIKNQEKPVDPQKYQGFDSNISSNIDTESKEIDSKEYVNAQSNLEKGYTNIENQEKPVDPLQYQDFDSNMSSTMDGESNEVDSEKLTSLNLAEQNNILSESDLSKTLLDKIYIPSKQISSYNGKHLTTDIEDSSSENLGIDNQMSEETEPNKNDVESSEVKKNLEEIESDSLVSENASEVPKNEDTSKLGENVFADDTLTQKQIGTPNERTEQEQFEKPNYEESSGIFSIFASFFDWLSSNDKNGKLSAIDGLKLYKEDHLQCEASNKVMNNIDYISFSPYSNSIVYLITTIVVFITFLFFYISVNKFRIESPLVAKINQLEKDLLIIIKEKENLMEKCNTEVMSDQINTGELIQINQRLLEVSTAKKELEIQISGWKEELNKKDSQIENLEKELETSTEVGMELNRIISEMLDPTNNGSDKLKENVEQLQRQLQEQREVIKNISARLNFKEAENTEMLLEVEETRKNSSILQQRVHELEEKVTSTEKAKDVLQNALQNEIRLYQINYNELVVKEQVLNNEIQILKTKLVNSDREIGLKVKECNSLKESFKDITSMKNDSQKISSLLDTVAIKAEYEQMKVDIEKYTRELKQNQSEKATLENNYQSLVQEMNELTKKYQETDKEKLETDLKLNVLNNYFKKREAELQEEVLKYKSIWDAKEGEATTTTERIKLLQEEIENYKTQNDALKQEILSQEIALKSQISVLEKKAHENWVNARQSERKLDDARQEAAQLRNRLTFRQRNFNDDMVQNGLDQNDSIMSSQPPIYSPVSPPLFYDNGRDQVTKSPLPGLPPFLPPPPGAPFVPPPVPNLPGMSLPPFMPPLPTGFPGDHRPPPLGRMSSPPIKSRYSPDASAFSPYERTTPSPMYDSEYGGGPYRNYSPYNSEDDRRAYRSPSPVTRTKTRVLKKSIPPPSGGNRFNESVEKTNSKKSNIV